MNRQSNQKITALYCRVGGGKYMPHALDEIKRQHHYAKTNGLSEWKGGRA